MGKVVKKTIYLFVPLLLYYLLTFTIDPYGYFRTHFVRKDIKSGIAHNVDSMYFTFMKYYTHPKAVVLIGDSRIGLLNGDALQSMFNNDAYVISIGMASLLDEIESFDFIKRNDKLKKVIIGVHLGAYNAVNNRDAIGKATQIGDPLYWFFYPFNRSVAVANFGILQKMIFNKSEMKSFSTNQVPGMTKEKFWDYQLENVPRKHYERYIYPKDYKKQLTRIATYCKKNDIDLRFAILPTHTDEIEMVDRFNRQREMEVFKKDISQLAPLYDFGFPNEFTTNRDNFSDPYHFNGKYAEEVLKDLFSTKPRLARVIFSKVDTSSISN